MALIPVPAAGALGPGAALALAGIPGPYTAFRTGGDPADTFRYEASGDGGATWAQIPGAAGGGAALMTNLALNNATHIRINILSNGGATAAAVTNLQGGQ